MAKSSLLSLVQTSLQAMGVMDYGQPTSVAGNSSQFVAQTLALMNLECSQLAREHQWQASTVEYRFTTTYYQYTGDLTAGSTSVANLSGTTGLTSDSTFQVTGTGINQDTYLTSVSGATGTLSKAASATGTAVQLTFAKTKYAMPSDFDRLVDRTDWDKSKHWEMLGPETAQQWQWLKSGYISTGPRVRFRPMGNYFQLWPPLSTNEYLGFEYVSKNWVVATGDVAPSKSAFGLDTDSCIFPDPLMYTLVRLAFYQAKGFDTQALMLEYQTQKNLAKAHDAGSPVLSYAPRISNVLIGWENIPDSGFGA